MGVLPDGDDLGREEPRSPDTSSLPPAGIDSADPLARRFLGSEGGVETPDRPPGSYRDIVVIGASAGGVEALGRLIPALPRDLPAAVFVVLHLSARSRSVLPMILERLGELPASVPNDRERPARGHIYVAPPDRHLLLVGDEMRLSAGPRENGHRPAIDPLFRSAARSYGPSAIAIVLSGNLDDGAAGARLIRERGGAVLVQDEDDALHPAMPHNAALVVDPDAVLPADALGARICELLEEPIADTRPPGAAEAVEEADAPEAAAHAVDGVPTELACPECGGPLWERDEGAIVRFACRTGHVYSSDSLVAEHGKELERALWVALRGLEERADLYRRMARRAVTESGVQRRFIERSEAAEEHARAVREAIGKITAAPATTRAELEAAS